MAIGALVRHFFNRRHGGKSLWWIPAVAALGVAGIAIAIRPDDSTGGAGAGRVSFASVQSIVEQRCVPCHQEKPHQFGISTAPMGVKLDDPEAIVALAQAIKTQAVDTKEMPIGNLTGMTDAERATIGAWVDQGAKR